MAQPDRTLEEKESKERERSCDRKGPKKEGWCGTFNHIGRKEKSKLQSILPGCSLRMRVDYESDYQPSARARPYSVKICAKVAGLAPLTIRVGARPRQNRLLGSGDQRL
jgi:hypothetical protein